MWTRLGKAAMVAAMLALATNSAWAEKPAAKSGCGKCCEQKNCCKAPQQTQGKILNVNRDVVYFGAGVRAVTGCCKDKCGGCCTAKSERAKIGAPAAPMVIFMPVPVGPGAMCPMMPPIALPPPAPPMPAIAMPPPHNLPMPMMPPMMAYCVGQPNVCPCPAKSDSYSPVLSVAADVCRACTPMPSLPSMCAAALGYLADVCNQRCCTSIGYPSPKYLAHPPAYCPPQPPELRMETAAATELLPPPLPDAPVGHPIFPPPPMLISVDVPAASSPLIRVSCEKAGNRLEWNIGAAHMSCKKISVDMGKCPLTMYTAQGKICIRAAEMKARADSILTDRKDRIILQGDALLHYCKGDQRIHMNAERIELNLRTGAVTIQP